MQPDPQPELAPATVAPTEQADPLAPPAVAPIGGVVTDTAAHGEGINPSIPHAGEAARAAKRRLFAALIASAPRLDQPYPDAPEHSPWTWSVRPAMAALDEALQALLADESRYRQLWYQTVRERAAGPAKPDDPEELRARVDVLGARVERDKAIAERDEAQRQRDFLQVEIGTVREATRSAMDEVLRMGAEVKEARAERDRLAATIQRVRELAEGAVGAVGVGCLSRDASQECPGTCGGHRATGWTLDPARILATLGVRGEATDPRTMTDAEEAAKPPPDASWLQTPEVREGDRRRAEATEADIRHSPDYWIAAGVTDRRILDPDGWRGKDAPTWDTPITRAEFERRLARCTTTGPVTKLELPEEDTDA